jgi:hypothetical protein
MAFMDWIKQLVANLLATFKSFLTEVFNKETSILIAEFKDFALSVIGKLATTDLTSESKRAEAFKAIKEEAIKRGKTLSDSMINLLIELAVTWYKNNKPA